MRGGLRQNDKVSIALRNCDYSYWALKEGEQLRKRQKQREEEVEGQVGKLLP